MQTTYPTVTAWREWMQAAGLSDRTITEWPRIASRLADHAATDPANLHLHALTAWLATLTLAASSRRNYITALRAYYGWIVNVAELRADNPARKLPRVRVPRAVPRPVATDDLAHALASGRFYAHTRTYILLAAYQGLRACEVAAVCGEHIDLTAETIRVHGKGESDWTIPLHPLIAAEAAHYPRVGPWFPSPDSPGGHVLARSVSTRVSLALRRSGVGATCHQLRHWYGTHLLRSAGGNVRVAQEGLRHVSLANTMIYTQVEQVELREALHRLPSAA